MHPKTFEKVYVRKDILLEDLEKMLMDMSQLEYSSLGEYDKGGFDGYNQAVTEIMKKINSKYGKFS